MASASVAVFRATDGITVPNALCKYILQVVLNPGTIVKCLARARPLCKCHENTGSLQPSRQFEQTVQTVSVPGRFEVGLSFHIACNTYTV